MASRSNRGTLMATVSSLPIPAGAVQGGVSPGRRGVWASGLGHLPPPWEPRRVCTERGALLFALSTLFSLRRCRWLPVFRECCFRSEAIAESDRRKYCFPVRFYSSHTGPLALPREKRVAGVTPGSGAKGPHQPRRSRAFTLCTNYIIWLRQLI